MTGEQDGNTGSPTLLEKDLFSPREAGRPRGRGRGAEVADEGWGCCGRGARLRAVHQQGPLTAGAGAPPVPSPATLISTQGINQLFIDPAECTGGPDGLLKGRITQEGLEGGGCGVVCGGGDAPLRDA